MKDEAKTGLVDLRDRTPQYANRIIKLYLARPKSEVGYVLAKQLLRSGTSVGAHYREACRGRSNAKFISKLEVGIQELDESAYWLELLADNEVLPSARLADLMKETNEFIAILTTCVKKAKQGVNK